MKKGVLAALAVLVMAAALAAGRPIAAAGFDRLIGRYPGATRLTNEAVDLDYLRRGWLSRQAAYQTSVGREDVERWYLARYGPVPEADLHAGTACGSFRTTKAFLKVEYAVAVTLCSVPAGTHIVVNESAFFPLGAATPPP